MKKTYFLLLVFVIMLLWACTPPVEEGLVNFPEEPMVPLQDIKEAMQTPDEKTVTLGENNQEIVINEGDLIKLSLKAVDPDGNEITYKYSSPLDDNGEWQTTEGDAGQYDLTVTASDGELTTSKTVSLVVRSKDLPPVITNYVEFQEIIVDEGDTITIKPKVEDPEGKDVLVSFSGFMETGTYKTTYDDAGTYTVDLKASDGKNEVTKIIKVIVLDKNRAPIFDSLDDITVREGDKVVADVSATDPDGDPVEIELSKPLDQDGEWQTAEGDAGTYQVTAIASDGLESTTQTFDIFVLSTNNPPVFGPLSDIIVREGETVRLDPRVSDPDGDEVQISYSGFMEGSVYETDFSDAGEYKVTITATDGKDSVSKTLRVTVIDQNRPPMNLEIQVTIVSGGN